MNSTPEISILLVDDHLAIRVGLTTIIHDQPDMKIVAEASNGQTAVELFVQFHPDIVLLDLRLPGLSGVEALVKMRDHDPEAKAIVLTTLDREEEIYHAMESGAKGYLFKDMRKQDLIEAIRVVHGGGRWLASGASARLAERVLHKQLTTREAEILRLIVSGKSNKQIATAVFLSEETVKWHMKSLFTKLEVSDRTQAAVIAIQRGLVQV